MSDERDAAAPQPEPVEVSQARAEQMIHNPEAIVEAVRQRPELLQHLAAGYHAAREGFTEFVTANDRSASRVKDTADKVIDSIQEELARDGLDADQRYRLIEAEERVLGKVAGSEEKAMQANERSFNKVLAVGAGVAVGVVVLGYLAKEGKLPPLPPPTV